MTARLIILGFAWMLLALAGCGDTASTTNGGGLDAADAAQTLTQMLGVAEQGDWGAYVDRFYGEQHKFGSPADREKLVKRFEDTWGTQVLEALGRAANLTPRIEGDKALFEDPSGVVYVLHRGPDGGWTFHL